MEIRYCLLCFNPIDKPIGYSLNRYSTMNYCSRTCATKSRWSDGPKWRKSAPTRKGKTYNELYGSVRAEEIRNKISIGTKNGMTDEGKLRLSRLHSNLILDKCPSWKGGLSLEVYPKEFKIIKDRIKTRDINCKICGNIDDIMCVHHIDYDKKNCDQHNLILLCRSCHGKTNGNRGHWMKFFKELGVIEV